MTGEAGETLDPALLTTPLTTRAEAEGWIHAMHAAGYGAHPDEDGGTLITGGTGTPEDPWVPLFTADEADRYNERMDEVFNLVENPYAVGIDAFHKMNPEEATE